MRRSPFSNSLLEQRHVSTIAQSSTYHTHHHHRQGFSCRRRLPHRPLDRTCLDFILLLRTSFLSNPRGQRHNFTTAQSSTPRTGYYLSSRKSTSSGVIIGRKRRDCQHHHLRHDSRAHLHRYPRCRKPAPQSHLHVYTSTSSRTRTRTQNYISRGSSGCSFLRRQSRKAPSYPSLPIPQSPSVLSL